MKNDQIFTPDNIIHEMLSILEYNPNDKLTILEPSFGDGNFLEAIVRVHRTTFVNDTEFLNSLDKIYGFEIDPILVKSTEIRLANLIHPLTFNFNLFCVNTLTEYKNYQNHFDFIIGNPPYIKIHDLDETERELVKTFSFCEKGTADMYMAFIEAGLSMLKPSGKMSLITPNTFIKSASAGIFRKKMNELKYLSYLKDHGSKHIFKGIGIYTCISLFSKKQNNSLIIEKNGIKRYLDYNTINSDWVEITKNKTLKEFVDIDYGIQTGNNTIYFFDKLPDFIESAIFIKLMHGSSKKEQYCLFPYKKINNKYECYTEEEMKNTFPLAFKYLYSHKNELEKRDGGKKKYSQWFAFSREQGLKLSKPSLLIPTFLKDVFIQRIVDDCVIRSGYRISPVNMSIDELEKILLSSEFNYYIKQTGFDIQGGYINLTKKHIEGFVLDNI